MCDKPTDGHTDVSQTFGTRHEIPHFKKTFLQIPVILKPIGFVVIKNAADERKWKKLS